MLRIITLSDGGRNSESNGIKKLIFDQKSTYDSCKLNHRYVRYTNTDIFVTFLKIFCQLGIFCVNLGFLGPRAWEFAKTRVEALDRNFSFWKPQFL